MTAEIRPGVRRPDWSVVTSAAARAALLGRDRTRHGLAEKWNHALEPAQDHVWRAVLQLFARAGRPPCLHEIGEETGLSLEHLRAVVAELEAQDLLASDKATDTILYAYPFAGEPTEHRVELHGRQLHAVCAIDALGVGGMFGADIIIAASCRGCASSIKIATAESGKSLSHVRPADAVVWYDLAYSGPAATSCCPSIAFFCSDAELQRWLSAQSPQRAGYRLSLDEALEVGRALFEPVLATS